MYQYQFKDILSPTNHSYVEFDRKRMREALNNCANALSDNELNTETIQHFNLFHDNTKATFEILIRKITLYGHESEQIWEYISQIRDIYQQQLDVHQNIIMKFLTIVTTLFMPLTLIAGWYGMNFEYMPELTWKYGYPLVFILSCIIVIVLCVIFRKKNWW